MKTSVPPSIILFVIFVILHAVFGIAARISLRSDKRAIDELFAVGSNQLFGGPLYLRARFLLPWVHPASLLSHSSRVRLLVSATRIAGSAAVASLLWVIVGQGLPDGP